MQALKKTEDAPILWDSAKRVNESFWFCDNFIAPISKQVEHFSKR